MSANATPRVEQVKALRALTLGELQLIQTGLWLQSEEERVATDDATMFAYTTLVASVKEAIEGKLRGVRA